MHLNTFLRFYCVLKYTNKYQVIITFNCSIEKCTYYKLMYNLCYLSIVLKSKELVVIYDKLDNKTIILNLKYN